MPIINKDVNNIKYVQMLEKYQIFKNHRKHKKKYMKSKNNVNKKWEANKLQNNRRNRATQRHNKEKDSSIHNKNRIIRTSMNSSPHSKAANK